MKTGIDAWIANHEFDFSGDSARIDLPGGWHWDISPDETGLLVGPDGSNCVGYDINNSIMQFGGTGQTNIPGLNLWTVQEVGEKFARSNYMDDATAKAYDAFAEKRGNARKEYEKGVRSELAGLVQLSLNEGKWTAYVDVDAVKEMTGIDTKPELTAEQGIALFNQMSEARHVMPLRDPLGYMTLDNNLYDYIKDQYEFQYDDTIQNIDAGFINGSGRGCEAILDNLDASVRKNIREYCLPEGMHYQHLRHVETTPELESAVNKFVSHRVTQTVNYEKKRSHSPESLAKDYEKFLEAGNALKEQIEIAAMAPWMGDSKDKDKGLTIE